MACCDTATASGRRSIPRLFPHFWPRGPHGPPDESGETSVRPLHPPYTEMTHRAKADDAGQRDCAGDAPTREPGGNATAMPKAIIPEPVHWRARFLLGVSALFQVLAQ
jgi:hypothetical protein